MEHLERSAASKGATVAYGCEVTGISREARGTPWRSGSRTGSPSSLARRA